MQFITSFKDHQYLYIGLEWLAGGDLYSLMNCQKFSELQAQFYAGQIVIALDYLHEVEKDVYPLLLRKLILLR